MEKVNKVNKKTSFTNFEEYVKQLVSDYYGNDYYGNKGNKADFEKELEWAFAYFKKNLNHSKFIEWYSLSKVAPAIFAILVEGEEIEFFPVNPKQYKGWEMPLIKDESEGKEIVAIKIFDFVTLTQIIHNISWKGLLKNEIEELKRNNLIDGFTLNKANELLTKDNYEVFEKIEDSYNEMNNRLDWFYIFGYDFTEKEILYLNFQNVLKNVYFKGIGQIINSL